VLRQNAVRPVFSIISSGRPPLVAGYIPATSGEQLDEVIENTGRTAFWRMIGEDDGNIIFLPDSHPPLFSAAWKNQI